INPMPFFCIHCRSEIDSKFKACPYCGEPITDFLRKHLEHPLDGKYQILSRLGIGGMGEVYKVLHLHLNSIRVIKLMRTSIAGEPGADDRFIREARLATRINHPNVAQLYDFSTLDDGSRYMVWEYIEGTNLHELIETHGPLSPEYLGILDAGERIDGRADLYSFGIVLYEMLTGVPPFQADTPHAYLMLHASEKPRALREVNPSMPSSPELEAIIFRALEKDRK